MLTPAQMEDRLENIDRQLDRIEQILPTLASKDDLQAFATTAERTFATKDDLQAFAAKAERTFATKEDLKAFPTKDDLKAFATKEDLRAFATKEDLKAFATKQDLREAFEQARSETRALFENMIDRIKMLGEGRRQ